MALAVDPETQNIDLKAWQYCHPHWHDCLAQISRHSPEALLIPKSREALQEIFRTAHRENIKTIPCGNGSKLAWGGLTAEVDWLVSTQQLNGIVDHAVDDLTITVEAGLTFQELQNYLRPYRQFLPLDPAFPNRATLGGIVATADTGSLRQRYGGVRDLLLGVTLVRADGTFAKAGGKVVKNVAGYDLTKLITGSYGSLATIVELTFRLYPIQEQGLSLLFSGDVDAIRQLQQGLHHSVLTPVIADVLSPRLMAQFNLGQGYGLLIRFEAIAESITAQREALEAMGQALNLQAIAQSNLLSAQLSATLHQCPVVCKVGILPSRSLDLLKHLERLADGQAIARIHSKSGLGTIAFPHEKFLRQFRELRQFCQQNSGFLTMLQGSYRLKQQFEPWGYPDDALPLMEKIKAQFDPEKILSPQRFVGGI
ncbi:FAD-binding oxidoreductase [Picosynechococcus sp. NKBG15041c]|uniref:FAD-binding oxidoreductase n=1 Tax=Picosynechococcus sp. NKBG15041c TaxID=1407650 RepID=UPI00041040DF|nr:FAD-binding oxidoreductase [Picosynechococcus sp. NKBG15041c]